MAQEQRTEIVTLRDWIDPEQKDENWILKQVQHNYTWGGAKSLTHGKNVQNIFNYASGKHSMQKFLAMFPDPKKGNKPNAKKLRGQDGPSDEQLANHTDFLLDKDAAVKLGMDLEPLGILQQPLASAIATLQKGTTTVTFTAIDATSNANKKMDLDRVANRPYFDQAIMPAREYLQMPLQPPRTKFNTPTVDMESIGLDPSKPDQLNLWADLFYKMRPESAFEVATTAIMDMTNFKKKLDLQKRDEIYFGCNTCRSFISSITDLPDYEYVFPGHVYTPPSELSDYSDQPFRFIEKNYTVEDILNTIGRDEMDAETMEGFFEDVWKAKGYTDWKWENAPMSRKMQGIPVVYMEFKSFDVLKFRRRRIQPGRTVSEMVPFGYRPDKNNKQEDHVSAKWPQQTYYAYWIPGTDHILKSGKVEGMFRAKGKENKSRFTILIEKSKDKSDVELCMTAVDDAQRAYIKLQIAVIMSKPKGIYVDFKYLRAAAESMASKTGHSVNDLLWLFFVKNTMIGDTQDMDGQNEGNFPPFREIPGGLGPEVREFLEIIQDSQRRIAQLTGFNDALTGQTPNPDQLVGIQKLLLQSSLNSLHYAQKATKNIVEATVQIWAPMIQYICKPQNRNTQARRYLENLIGAYKIDVINSLEDLSVVQFGMQVEDAPDEQAQQELRQLMFSLLQGQRIKLSDYFLVRRVMNYKDAEQLLVLKEKQQEDALRKERQEQNTVMQNIAAQKEQGLAQREMVKGQVADQVQQRKNEGLENIQQMKNQLELILSQINERLELSKKQMQGDQQKDKMFQKHNLDKFNFA